MQANSLQRKQATPRNSSIELLRILSMLGIVFCHVATHGGFGFSSAEITVPRLWWNVLELGGNFGVDVFVLISGYFLVQSKKDRLSLPRVLKFWGQVFFYSVALFAVFVLSGLSEWSLGAAVKSLFPVTFGSWWFASTYFVLYLLHPFLNMALRKLEKKQYQGLLAMLLVLWCIIPTFTTSKYEGNHLLWFVTLYCVAGYVGLFGLNPRWTAKHYWMFWAVFTALRYLSAVVLMVIGTRIPLASDGSLYFYSQQSVLTFLSALSLFMAFLQSEMGYHKWINTLASATFGVYLLHDSNLTRPFLWKTVFQNAQLQNSVLLIPYSVFAVLSVYAVCTAIDLLRQKTVEKGYMLLVNRYADACCKPFAWVLKGIKNLICGKE